jgi:hypothetical protein
MKISFDRQPWLVLGLLTLGTIAPSCAGKSFETGNANGSGGQAGTSSSGAAGTAGNSEQGGMAGVGGNKSCQTGEVLGCASAKELSICSADGSHLKQPCTSETPICTGNGSCVQCLNVDDCKGNPGPCYEKTCSVQQECGKVPLKLGTDCGSGKICNGNGECGDCEPGMKRCSDDKVELCDSKGNWLPDGTCSEQGMICGAGECSPPSKVASQFEHSCLRLENGVLLCWGSNNSGQIGAANLKVPVPFEIKSLGHVEDVAVSLTHTCALKQGDVYC